MATCTDSFAHRPRRAPGSTPRLPWRRAAAAALLLAAAAAAQETAAPAKPSLFKDPKDGAFDISGWAATQTGVIPMISPITEPAVGYGALVYGILIHGGGFAALEKAPPGVTGKPVPPDISAGGGAYTENGTWMGFVGHLGFWGGDRWRYVGALARMSPNFDVYDGAGNAYGLNLDGWAVYQEVRRRVALTDLFVGARWVWTDSTLTFDLGDSVPDDFDREGRKVRSSGLGLVAEYDTRDNIFTPNRGSQVKASATFFRDAIGSDRDYDRYTLDGTFFLEADPRLVLSGRVRTQNVAGDEPFYARPYVRLRGVAAMRYQGETAVSVEGEARYGLTTRWWLVGFGGAGWTDAGDVRVLEDESVTAGGVGFRYLIARALGLQMGVDVAKGPEEWVGYIIFGTAW